MAEPESTSDATSDASSSRPPPAAASESPGARFRIEFPADLPISARADAIIELLGKHQVVILAGETGSGKTTQIPKMCLAAGRGTRGQVACTQPRRVAALSVSRRVAEQLAVNWGREVGCKIHFDDAPIVQVSGRTFPVEVIYAPLDSLGSDAAEGDEPESRPEALHYVDGAVEAVQRILEGRAGDAGGDILVFMPAERDIRECCELLEGRHRHHEVIPLFGRLSQAEQQRIFAGSQRRKIIVATNIAETSLTLPGIRYVVDTGLARVSRYVPAARPRRLPIEEVAQSSCDQRKGRAGRVAEGVCVRLYSEEDYNARPRFAQPEIQRANLADVILRLKAFGLGDIERFPFINMPATKSIRAGYALLEELGPS